MLRPAFLALVILIQLPCIGLVSTNIPLTHWSYDAIETLADAGLVQSDLLSTKPFSRLEMGRLLLEARDNVDPNTGDDSLYIHLLERLEREFSYERDKLSGSGEYSGSFLKPFALIGAIAEPVLLRIY